MVKLRDTSCASLLTTHWTSFLLIFLVGTPNRELIVVVVSLPFWVEFVVALTLSPSEPVIQDTSAGGLESAAIHVARRRSSSPSSGYSSFTLTDGSTRREHTKNS